MIALAAIAVLGAAEPSDRCSSLRKAVITNVEIATAKHLSGSFKAPDGSELALAPLCRVRGIARPTAGSHIIFELWLPRDRWNGRYYQLGNGGFAGSIHYPSLAAEAARGNAAAITDTGHRSGGFDATWAAGQPVAITDYGHRSIKATADAARALIAAYYGRPPAWRYFAGCSTGGRQALMAAQRYPDDWDGIIAGAPANMWTRQLASFAAIQQRLRTVPSAWLPPAKLEAIQRAALATCPHDTVVGGVALDPPKCRFDPATMACRDREHDRCLSAAQLASMRQIQAAGYQPTSAAIADNWTRWMVNPNPATPSQLTFATQAFRYLLQHNRTWQLGDFNRHIAIPREVQWALDADSLDYDRFRARGGRIISYFGWADAVISPGLGLDYYRRVARRGGGDRVRQFYRLFMVPGMTHCQGGPAPDSFGQSLTAPALRADPTFDIRLALERWVERGVAPHVIVAVRHRNASRSRSAIATTRLHPVR